MMWIWPLDGPDGCIDEAAPLAGTAGVEEPLDLGAAEDPEEVEEPAEPGCEGF